MDLLWVSVDFRAQGKWRSKSGFGILVLLGSLCKSGSWCAFELKEVMDKVKDNVCVGVCFVDLLWISGDFR